MLVLKGLWVNIMLKSRGCASDEDGLENTDNMLHVDLLKDDNGVVADAVVSINTLVNECVLQ